MFCYLLFKEGWILIGCQLNFIFFLSFLDLKGFFKLYLYCCSYHCWCEQCWNGPQIVKMGVTWSRTLLKIKSAALLILGCIGSWYRVTYASVTDSQNKPISYTYLYTASRTRHFCSFVSIYAFLWTRTGVLTSKCFSIWNPTITSFKRESIFNVMT